MHGGGGWGGGIGEVRLEDFLRKEVNFDCCQEEFA